MSKRSSFQAGVGLKCRLFIGLAAISWPNICAVGQDKGDAAKSALRNEKPKPASAKPATPKTPTQTAGHAASNPSGADKPTANPSKTAIPAAIEESERNRRLDYVERTLRELQREVEQLRAVPVRAANQATAAVAGALPQSWMRTISWRSIGPANMGGRIVDLAVNESDSSMFWVATASGGLLKTINNGITFEHQFDNLATVSIGAVAVAPSDPSIVWVGTGENNPRNSVSYGDGVYKSSDGGKTWKNMGLTKSFQIGRIVIHPKNPNVVYVGAIGRLYGPNSERGLFKTDDGGQRWQKVLYVDDKTGVIDLRLHPAQPDTLITATWEVLRDGFDSWPGNEVPKPDGVDGYDPIKKWGAGSGLFKSNDGGKSWRKLTNGLPTGKLGRIGLDWHRKDPKIVVAVIDCEGNGKGPKPIPVYLGLVGYDRDGAAHVTQVLADSPAAKAGVQVGDVLNSLADKPIRHFDDLLDVLRERRPGQTVSLAFTRGGKPDKREIVLTSRPSTPTASGAGGVWLGVVGETTEQRVRVIQVLPEGPAAKADLRVGDHLTAIDGKSVIEYGQLMEMVRTRQPGDKLVLGVLRQGKPMEVAVTLESRPGPATGPAQSDVYLGIFGEDADDGARVTRLSDDGPAEKAGLNEGDVIRAIDNRPLTNYAALLQRLQTGKAGEMLSLSVRRGSDQLTVVVTLENRPGGPTSSRPYVAYIGGQAANIQDQQGSRGHEFGGVYLSNDGGESWRRVNSLNPRPMYFSQVRVDPADARFVYVLGIAQHKSSDGGQTFDANFGRNVHADGHALWIDPRDGRHMILGTDGGTYVTYDRGGNWDHLNHTAIGQFYHVAIAPKAPYNVVGGLQDNGSWLGPSASLDGGGPINEDWISVGGGDGFMCRVDPDDPDLVYYTSQNGAMGRRNLRTGERAAIRPRRQRGTPSYRFNWNTPFILSGHNSRIFYAAGNYVFRSFNRGENLEAISPEITRTKRGSATALSESPKNSNLLYVGTDDGALWVTRNGGRDWADIAKNVNLASPRWVATIEASHFEEGRVYVCFDGHRSDDDDPYVFVSEDYGQSWRSIRANLPWGSTRCVREDLQNPNLLFAGTEFGAWCSIDRGQTWNRMNSSLPTVAVHEFAIHPANGELVAATHGRSLWICDIAPLRQFRPEHLSQQIALYKSSKVTQHRPEPSRGRTNRRFVGANPPAGAQIYYSLPNKVGQLTIRIFDIDGNTVRELRGPTEPGLHRIAWDLTRTAQQTPRPSSDPSAALDPASGGRRGPGGGTRSIADRPGRPAPADSRESRPTTTVSGSARTSLAVTPESPPAAPEVAPGPFGRRGTAGGRPVSPGDYRIVLSIDGRDWTQTVRIESDPNFPTSTIAEDFDWEAAEQSERDAKRVRESMPAYLLRIDD